MEIKKISIEQYDKFLSKQKNYDFLQSTQEAKKLINQGKEVEFIQVVKNGDIVVTAMLTYVKFAKIFTYCNILRGFFMDYHDKKLIEEFFKTLKVYLRKKHVIYLEMDPRIDLVERDVDGNIVTNGFDNNDVVENLKSAGMIQCPLSKGYQPLKNCRWVSILDIKNKNCDEIFSNFSSLTRRNIRISQKYCVETRTINKNELDILDKLIKKTEERHNYKERTIDFYRELYDNFGNKHIKTILAYLNVEKYGQRLAFEMKELEESIEKLKKELKEDQSSTKKIKRLKFNEDNLKCLIKKIDSLNDLKAIYGNEIPLACSLYIKIGDSVLYLSGASDYEFKDYRGSYAIHWNMIQEAVKENYSNYDFYGISGNFNENEDGYGVFNFKRGFGAIVHEYIGIFILPINKLIFNILNKIKNIY